MNAWQKKFAQKMDGVRSAAQERFEQFACETLTTTFDNMKAFTAELGLQGASPLATQGMRTFKFEMTENTYLLMTFRAAGFDGCEVESEFFVPQSDRIAPSQTCVPLLEANAKWAQGVFEDSLDRFAEALAGAFESSAETAAVAANEWA